MASNPGHVPAGGREKISVVVSTSNRGGSSLHKRFNVQTNDPGNQRIELVVVGRIKGFFKVTPQYVRLIGTRGNDIHTTVHIVPEKEFPFTVTSVKAKEGRDIDFELKPLGKDPRKDGYNLVVSNTRTEKGAYRDFILIQTDLKEKPTVRIPVTGRIMEEKNNVSPARIPK